MILRTRGLLLKFLCAAALLFAQHGAVTHQIWHGAAGGGAPPLAAGTHAHENPATSEEALCDLHLALATVLGALDCILPEVPLALARASTTAPDELHSYPVRGLRPGSRGPPSLL